MASSIELDLILQAVDTNSVPKLKQVRDNYGLKTIVIILSKCNELNLTPVQLAITKKIFYFVKWCAGQFKESFMLNLD
jgi:hypothetical protein